MEEEKPEEARANPYHDPKNGRFTTGSSSSSPLASTKKKLGESDVINDDDVFVGHSAGAKAKNYDVYDPKSGEKFSFAEGARIQDVQIFAGKGCKTKLKEEVSQGLANQIGGNASEWQHAKGVGVLNVCGEERKAEVHWFQEKTLGRHKFKVKRWLDDES